MGEVGQGGGRECVRKERTRTSLKMVVPGTSFAPRWNMVPFCARITMEFGTPAGIGRRSETVEANLLPSVKPRARIRFPILYYLCPPPASFFSG